MFGLFKSKIKGIRENADLGNADAQYHLAVMYEKGENGVEQNDNLAAKYFKLAANQDFGPAQLTLGFFYCNGIGVSKNYKEAIKWYRKSAQKGDIFSAKNLAVLFGQGLGCKQSHFMAYWYFLIAAKLGDEEAKAAQFKIHEELLTSSELKKIEKMDGKEAMTLLFPN